MANREWYRDHNDWDRPRSEFLDRDRDYDRRRQERGYDNREYDRPRPWRAEEHEDPGVVDKVRNWWHRNVSEPEYHDRRPREYDLDRDYEQEYGRGIVSAGHSGWTRDRDWGDREWTDRDWRDRNRSNTSDWDYGRHDRDWRTESYSRGAGAAAYGTTGHNYGGGIQTDYRGYTGRGPKGWRRSDERIREEVNEELTRHPDVDASDIEVAVINGEVTLTGQVDSRQEKREAEDCAWRVSGVKDVHTQLRMKQGVGSIISQVFDRDRR